MPAPDHTDPITAGEGYCRALSCLDAGDDVAARRAVEEGLARSWPPQAAATRDCLDDLGSQLDGEAALQRFAGRTPGPRGWLARPDDFARSVLGLGRAHLVELVIEEVALMLPPPVLLRLITALDRAGTPAARDLLAACGAVLPGEPGRAARTAAGILTPQSAAARALARPALAGAWWGRTGMGHDQQQVIVALARDGGRVAPLVALVDQPGPDAVLRDAFFLPDMVPGRLQREVLSPLGAAGIPVAPADASAALGAACAALSGALARGRQIPSEAHQSVIARMLRLHAALGRPGGPGASGNAPLVG